MVKLGKEFTVIDANSGEDLTSQVLTQIILEQELKGTNLLPANFLRSVIRFYDDSMGGVMQHYLDASMKGFVQNQDKMRGMLGDVSKAMHGLSPLNHLEEMTRQNVALFEKAFGMFNPFASIFAANEDKSGKPGGKK